MMHDSSVVSEDALEDVSYLARSANRITLLKILTSDSCTRRDLADRTGVSSSTIGRILNELSDRDWIERTTDGEYVATPVGRQVVSEFIPLVKSMAAIQKLGETVAWFQAADLAIGLEQLDDATVIRPDPADPLAPLNTYLVDLRAASKLHCLVGIAPPESFEEAMRDGVVERGMDVEHVISDSEYRYLLDFPDRLERWREYIEAGANVYRYGGAVPCNVMIFDETVYIANTQSEYGHPYTAIASDSDRVLSWAQNLVEKYLAESERLTPGDFAEGTDQTGPDDK